MNEVFIKYSERGNFSTPFHYRSLLFSKIYFDVEYYKRADKIFSIKSIGRSG